jgi:hypothetical protein
LEWKARLGAMSVAAMLITDGPLRFEIDARIRLRNEA